MSEDGPNLYRRGSTYWGRLKIKGSEKRWSLRTSDLAEAQIRLAAGRSREERLALGLITADPDQWVYFVHDHDHGAVKIGFSCNPERRAVNLQTASVGKLELLGFVPGGKDMERLLQNFMGHYHIRREWFDATAEILAFVRALIALKGAERTKAPALAA